MEPGGYNGSAWLNDLWKFDIQSKRWSCIQDSSDPLGEEDAGVIRGNDGMEILVNGVNGVRGKKPSRRFGYVSVVHDNKLVIFGGFDGSQWLNDMHVFDFDNRTWTEVHAQGVLPSVRSCPAWVKDEIEGVLYIQGKDFNAVIRFARAVALTHDRLLTT
jgi:leucine-zipper-like transcriptional regulator 1